MTSPFTRFLQPAVAPAAALLPGNRFFVRRLELDGPDAAAQVNLALEALSPFPLEQMLVGHVVSPDGRQALAYAAHRRRFTPEESFAWPDDCQVIPEFLALCGQPPAQDGVVVHRGEERLTALAWKAGDVLPAAVVVAELADADGVTLAKEAAERAGLAATTPVETITGALTGAMAEQQLRLRADERAPFVIDRKHLDDADIRDADFLAQRRKKERTNLLLWNITRLAAAALVVAALLDLTALGITLRSRKLEVTNQERAPIVAEIEAAQAVAARIAELGAKRPLILEMLAVANEHRPPSLEFQRVTCKSPTLMEIEIRTTDAGDIGVFERSLAETKDLVAGVVSRDIRARESATTFTTTITFRPEGLRKAVAAAPAAKQ